MKIRISRPLLALTALLLLTPLSFATDEAPSATVVIDETQVMLLIGGDAGHGTLVPHFTTGARSFSVKGVKLGGVGIHKMHMTGNVYKLSKVSDFEGVYFVAEAGITLAKGKGGLWLENDQGVVMHLKSGAEGVALSIGVEGLKVKLNK